MTLRLEAGAHESAGPMQLRLARAFGNAEHLRRLSVRVTVYPAEHERVSRTVRQGADGAFDLMHFDGRIKRPLLREVPGLLTRVRRQGGQFGLRRNLAAPVQNHVYRNAVQPGSEAAPRLEALECPPGIEERVLRTVFRESPISCHPQAQSVDAADVVAIEALERAHIPTASPLHEACLPSDPVAFCSRDHAIHWTRPPWRGFKRRLDAYFCAAARILARSRLRSAPERMLG